MSISVSSPVIRRTTAARIPTNVGEFQLCHYANNSDGKEHLALVMGDVAGGEDVLVRVHSECMTGDVFGSLRCDCGEQLHAAMRMIAAEGRGAILYLRQEGRGIGLEEKLRAYNLQDDGYDTVDANLMLGHQADEREYWVAAGMLADLEVRSLRLLTNNPAKIENLRELGINITSRAPLHVGFHHENEGYLRTKVERMRHFLDLPAPIVSAGSGVLNGSAPSPVKAQLARLAGSQASFSRTDRPFVTISYAQSLDGALAAAPGQPTILSGVESLKLTHLLRSRHDAILAGIGTILTDDPQLTVRLVEGPDPQPIVVDGRLRFPENARLLTNPKRAWIATTADAAAAAGPHKERLEAAGAEIYPLPAEADGLVDLAALLATVKQRGIRSVMVEGGAQIIGALLAQRLVDFIIITIAPRLMGGLRLPAAYPAPLPRLDHPAYTPLGEDLVGGGRPEWSSGE